MKKSRWNNDLPTWGNERWYTKDEIDAMINEIRVPSGTVRAIVNYTNNTSQTVDFYAKITGEENVPLTTLEVTVTYTNGTTQTLDLYARL